MERKSILVTGASSGIGEAVARHFYQEGYAVIAVARNEEKLNLLQQELGHFVITYPADLSQLENVQKIFEFCKEQGLKLDGIVHAAGITMNAPLRANDVKAAGQLMRVNFEALVQIFRFASSKRYTNDGASIVAISSSASMRTDRGLSVYSASKAAVNMLVKSAAMELAARKIRVNAIAPAMVRTQMYYKTIEEIPQMENVVKNSQPFGLIEPKEIAEIALFLMSEKSQCITGSILVAGAGNVF